jgi:hypothetical protein
MRLTDAVLAAVRSTTAVALPFVLLLLLALAAPPARANIAQARPNPALLDGPRLDGASALRVLGEELELDCEEERGEPICRFTARYRFVNPSPTRQVALAAFYGVRTSELELVQDGRAVGRQLTAEQAQRLDRAAATGRGLGDVTRAGMELSVEAGRTALVTVRGRMAPGRYFSPSYALPVPRSRHLLLGGKPERSNRFHLDYLIAPIRSWGPAPAIAVTIRRPARWELALGCPRGSAGDSLEGARARPLAPRPTTCPAIRREHDGRRVVERLTIAGGEVDELNLAIELPPRLLWNGGVLAGIGGNLDDSGGLRARFGYEIAAPEWLLISLSVDTNFRDDLVLTPTIEAATPSVLILPSLGLGVGMPVRLVEDRRVGVRVQLTVHWPILGWVTCFDIFPGQGFSEPRRFQVSMLAQIGL